MFLVVIKAEVKSPHRAKIKKDDLKSHPFVVLLGVWVIDETLVQELQASLRLLTFAQPLPQWQTYFRDPS